VALLRLENDGMDVEIVKNLLVVEYQAMLGVQGVRGLLSQW